ncbi:MAG: PadR family transcriptional regulator [Desmonostoc vinosum HA7617-LM4]|nr:PadR family transcriptional regulator [Desmonostoc vinosum HA7617-LM4]
MEDTFKNKNHTYLSWIKVIALKLLEEGNSKYLEQLNNILVEKRREKPHVVKEQNDRELHILSSVEEDILSVLYPNKEVYGLAIINTIEEVSKGKRKIGPNTLYPTLRRMESSDKGYITSRWGDERLEELVERGGARRRYYKLTDKGREALEAVWEYRDNLLGIGFNQISNLC